MGFGLSVRRLVTEIFEHNHLKFAENRKITFFLQEPLKLNSEIFYCHRTSSFNVSHRFLGGGQSNFFSQSRPTLVMADISFTLTYYVLIWV